MSISLFVAEVAALLAPGSKVLELGCGYGQDATYLAMHGHDVVATDFSPIALDNFPHQKVSGRVKPFLMDSTSLPYPFANKHFDVVYAHLGLHYFSTDVTRGVFTEIARILDYGGRFFGLFNSIKDPEAGTGKLIEPNFYELSPGDCKRFFLSLSFLACSLPRCESTALSAGRAHAIIQMIRMFWQSPQNRIEAVTGDKATARLRAAVSSLPSCQNAGASLQGPEADAGHPNYGAADAGRLFLLARHDS